jgi:hypothetical protein
MCRIKHNPQPTIINLIVIQINIKLILFNSLFLICLRFNIKGKGTLTLKLGMGNLPLFICSFLCSQHMMLPKTILFIYCLHHHHHHHHVVLCIESFLNVSDLLYESSKLVS